MNRGTAKAILHLYDIAIKKGVNTTEGRDALRAANRWVADERKKKSN